MIGTEVAAKAAPDGYIVVAHPQRPADGAAAVAQNTLRSLKSFTPIGRVGDLY
jgi:hypothetical protein